MSKLATHGLGRQRSKIISDTKSQEYFALQQDPSESNILDYIARSFRSPSGAAYTINSQDYMRIRYLLSLVHCTNHANSAQVFIGILGNILNNDLDKYRIEISKLEHAVIILNHVNDKHVLGPSETHKPQMHVLGPEHNDHYNTEFATKSAMKKGHR